MKSSRVLVIFGQKRVRDFLERALHQRGYAVEAVADCQEAALRLASSETSLILVDIDESGDFPGLEGKVPVLAFGDPDNGEVLPRPFSDGFVMDEFLAEVQRSLETEAAPRLVCHNAQMKRIWAAICQVSVSDAPVVLLGESGSGKEVLARELHRCSPRANKPLVKLNCAALPPDLLESELFGYEKGAFTGAFRKVQGKLQAADGGTLFLDEIGDMDLRLQAKLLHVLQDWEFYQLGGSQLIRVNVRVVAATHQNLEKAVAEGRFRQDLYYRLSVVQIEIPPIRQRKDEIAPLMRHFLTKHGTPGQDPPEISRELEDMLMEYDWPGNVREIENLARRFLVFRDSSTIVEELRLKRLRQQPLATVRGTLSSLDALNREQRHAEADAIRTALQISRWNRRRAAALLQIDYKGLLYKMKKMGIYKPQGGEAKVAFEHVPTGLVI